MKDKTFEEKLSEIVRGLMFQGWEAGKEQMKSPYEYTLNTDQGEEAYKQLKALFLEEVMKAKPKRRIVIENQIYTNPDGSITNIIGDTFESKGYNNALDDWEENLRERLE